MSYYRRPSRQTQQNRRAEWMSQFNALVIQLDAKHAGRICWNTAAFFFDQGTQVNEAARRYCETRKEGN